MKMEERERVKEGKWPLEISKARKVPGERMQPLDMRLDMLIFRTVRE